MIATALLCLLAAPGPHDRQPVENPDGGPPNVVLFFCDDLGWGDVGCNAPEAIEQLPFSVTPNIDRLAAEGVRFTDFYVSQPVCSASRASLLTGCYANRIGIHGALGPGALHGLNSEETTLAELAREAGLATGIFGKWHLGSREEFLPTRHGFDRWVGIPYSNDMWPYHPEWVKPWEPLPLFRDESIVSLSADQRWLTTGLVDEALGAASSPTSRTPCPTSRCTWARPTAAVPASGCWRTWSPRSTTGSGASCDDSRSSACARTPW
ncbi:MAG: sulfatase-like hydrolase/transferase [Planctomycetota bacterium]